MKSLTKSLGRTSAQRWLSLAAILLVVLALAGVVALQTSRNAAAEREAQAHRAANTDLTLDSSQSDGTVKIEGKPRKIGSVAKIGSDYSVAVTDVTKYKGPKTLYLVAKIKAKYTGTEKGDPTDDLVAKFSQADLPTTVESACLSDFGVPDLSILNAPGQHKLAGGAVQTYAACIALPAEKINTGSVSIEASDAENERAFWTTSGAPTKDAPKPKPIARPGTPGGGKIHDPKAKKQLEKQIEKAEKGKKKLKKLVKQAKQIPGYKKKKIKKVEKQIDKLDDAIDQLKKLEKLYY